jgi:hypothetical protein
MMCPLIPVMSRLPPAWRGEAFRRATPSKVTRGYLNFFEPDAFVQTEDGQFEAAGLSVTRQWKSRDRFRSFDDLIASEPGREAHLSLGVSMHRVYDQLYRDEYQFKKRHEPKVYDFAGGDRVSSLFFEACYGAFPKDERLSYVRKFYQGALGAETVVPSVATWNRIEGEGAGYPLYYTTRDLEQPFEGGWDETIFIFDPLSAPDVLDFWNLRLFERDVLPVNSRWLAESRQLIIDAIRRNHRPLPSNPNGIMIGTKIVIGRSLDPAQVAEGLGIGPSDVPPHSARWQPWYDPIWMAPTDDRVRRPVAAPLIAKRQEVQLVPGERDRSIRLPRLSPAFGDAVRSRGPGWVNVVRTRFYGGNDAFAETMPSAAIDEHDSYPPRSFVYQIPTREGHVTFHNYPHDGASFQLATRQEAVFGWLKARGIEAKPSDAGRVADELIASVGGIGQSVLLAHPEVVTQLDKMARSRSERVGGDSEEFPDRTASIPQLSKMLSKVQAKRWGGHITLEHFVEAGALRVGIAVRCSHCTKENWYSLDDIASTVRCDRCLKHFDYPQGRPHNKDTWKYRVVGPFATSHYAQGAYAVALTLRFLNNQVGSMEDFTHTTSLDLEVGSEKLETDFFAWHNKHAFTRNARDPALLLGECKSFGTEVFKAADITRLRRIGELLPGAFLVAATLKTSLSRKEVAGLRALSRWGWRQGTADRQPTRVIVLTGTELFAIEPFHSTWEASGGALKEVADRYSDIFDFDTLARATQQAYLGLSENEIYGLTDKPGRKGPPPHAHRIAISF